MQGIFVKITKIAQNLIQSTGFIAAAHLAKLFKVSSVIGSYTAFFSLSTTIVPLSGAFAGLSGAMITGILKMVLGVIVYGALFPLHHLAFHLPGMFAAFYWASTSIMIRAFIPLICILLFVTHPIGSHAWPYAMYWWIPVILYFMNKKSISANAIGSTFVAHAVGSVIWLYTMPMGAATWLALMPIVLIERFLFAGGMVVLYHFYQQVVKKIGLPYAARRWRAV